MFLQMFCVLFCMFILHASNIIRKMFHAEYLAKSSKDVAKRFRIITRELQINNGSNSKMS